MDLLIYLDAIRRWWWLVIGLPLVVAAGAYVVTPPAPFTTEFRATVLIPGDTEDTGSAERPELMVLDDLPILVSSDVFAQATLEQMQADGTSEGADFEAVKAALEGSRYSRVLTVTVTSDDAETARRIAGAAAAVLPDAVNAYLVAPGTEPATVQVIDRPDEPTRDATMRWLRIAVMTFVAFCAALAIVAIIAAVRPPLAGLVHRSEVDAK